MSNLTVNRKHLFLIGDETGYKGIKEATIPEHWRDENPEEQGFGNDLKGWQAGLLSLASACLVLLMVFVAAYALGGCS